MNSTQTPPPLSSRRTEVSGRLIERADYLDSLVGPFNPLHKNHKRSNFTIHFPELSQQECASWEARLKHHYFACGCMEGSLASLGALIGYSVYVVFRSTGFMIGWSDSLWALGLFVVSGLAGKVGGLIYSHKQLERTIVELKAEIQKRSASTPTRGESHDRTQLH